MVNWIDEPEDEESDDETFTCPWCGTALTLAEGDYCPVCGEPLDDEPDAQAVAHLEAAYEERTETDYAGA